MKRLLKWLAIGVGVVLALLVLAVGAIYVVSSYRLTRTFSVDPPPVSVATDSATIQRGARLAKIYGCRGCHGGDSLGGEVLIDEPMIGRIVPPNLTRVAQSYSDLDFVRLIRHGVRPDGRGVLAGMPSSSFNHLDDADLGAIIAYMRSLPVLPDSLPSMRIGPAVRMAIALGQFRLAPDEIDHTRPPSEPVDSTDVEAYGRYLALAGCTECHGADLEGRTEFFTTPSLAMAAAYSRDAFRELMRTGLGLGGRELGMMSDAARGRFVNYTDHEIDALHVYLSGLAAAASGGQH